MKSIFLSLILICSVSAQEKRAQITILVDNVKAVTSKIYSDAKFLKVEVSENSTTLKGNSEYMFFGNVDSINKLKKSLEDLYEVVKSESYNEYYKFDIAKKTREIDFLKDQLKNIEIELSIQKEVSRKDTIENNLPYQVSIVIKNEEGKLVSDYNYKTNLKSEPSNGESVDDKYKLNLFTRKLSIKDSIFSVNNEIEDLKRKIGISRLNIMIKKRKAAGEDSDSFSLINMPGISYDFLKIENPDINENSEMYQGFRLKYLFSKGKTYFTVGALSSTEKKQNESQVTDLFIWGVGSDFYPRYLGRGKRTFLNLYSGLEFGGALYIKKDWSKHYTIIQPKLGLELIKTSRILLDVSGGYFIPFSIKKNQDYRGYLFSSSFNFIF